MASSGILRSVALVRIDVSELLSTSIISVTRIGELRITLVLTSSRRTLRRWLVTSNDLPSSPIIVTLMMEALTSFETSVLTTATQHNIPEDSIFHSQCRGNFKPYMKYFIRVL
jgi:hypothetical protein